MLKYYKSISKSINKDIMKNNKLKPWSWWEGEQKNPCGPKQVFFFYILHWRSLYLSSPVHQCFQCFQCFCSYHTLHKERIGNILHAVCQWFCSPTSSHWDSLNTVVGNLKSRRKFFCFWWDGFNPRWCPECTYEKKTLPLSHLTWFSSCSHCWSGWKQIMQMNCLFISK